MDKKNQLTGTYRDDDERLVLHTSHFSVTITFGDIVFRDVPRRTSQRIDSFLVLDYDITSKTTYTTKYQLKKFLRRFFMRLIKDLIHQHKEQK